MGNAVHGESQASPETEGEEFSFTENGEVTRAAIERQSIGGNWSSKCSGFSLAELGQSLIGQAVAGRRESLPSSGWVVKK